MSQELAHGVQSPVHNTGELFRPITLNDFIIVRTKHSKELLHQGWGQAAKEQRLKLHLMVKGTIVGQAYMWKRLDDLSAGDRLALLKSVPDNLVKYFLSLEHDQEAGIHSAMMRTNNIDGAKGYVRSINDSRRQEIASGNFSSIYQQYLAFLPLINSTSSTITFVDSHSVTVGITSILKQPTRVPDRYNIKSIIKLPILITLSFSHRVIGTGKVLAEVHYVQRKPREMEFVGGEYYNEQNGDILKCALIIRAVEPCHTPLDVLIGKHFTSFTTAAKMFGRNDGWNAWTILNQPDLTMKAILGGNHHFENPLLFQEPITFYGTMITEAYPMQLFIMSSTYDCNNILCLPGETCAHGVNRRHLCSENHVASLMAAATNDNANEREDALVLKMDDTEFCDLIRNRVAFHCDLQRRLQQNRITQGWDAIDPFVPGPHVHYHTHRFDYIKTPQEAQTFCHYFQFMDIYGVSKQNLFVTEQTNDSSQRLLIAKFQVKADQQIMWIPERTLNYPLYVSIPYYLLLHCIENEEMKTAIISKAEDYFARFTNHSSTKDAVCQLERALADGSSSIITLSDEVSANLELIGEYRVITRGNDPRRIIAERNKWASNRVEELRSMLHYLITDVYSDDEDVGDIALRKEFNRYLKRIDTMKEGDTTDMIRNTARRNGYRSTAGR